MNIGRPKRVIEVEPVTLPVPEMLPVTEPESEPVSEPVREPASPTEPAGTPVEPDG